MSSMVLMLGLLLGQLPQPQLERQYRAPEWGYVNRYEAPVCRRYERSWYEPRPVESVIVIDRFYGRPRVVFFDRSWVIVSE